MRHYHRRERRLNPFHNDALLTAGLVAGGLAILRLLRHSHPTRSLRDKVVLLTGGGRGLGLALARELAHEGARLAICARNLDELQDAAAELRTHGVDVRTFLCDVRDQAQVGAVVAGVEMQFGEIDILLNVAGVMLVGPLDALEREDFQESMDTHYWGALNVMQAVLPGMRVRQSGHIVNIASIGALLPVPHLVPYAASKAALRNLANGFRTEYAHEGIQFTTVCPGLMATGGQVHTIYRGDHQREFRWFTEIDNLPFLAATAEQAAREIVRAIKRGDLENYVTVNAKIVARLAGLFPNWTIRLSTAFNRLLPHHSGETTERRFGYEIPFAPTPPMEAAEQNAVDKNQYVAVREEMLTEPHGP